VLEAEAEADSLRIIFRSFPKSKHAWAMPAAIASVCGAEQNQRYYFDLSTYFYAHQPDLTASTVYSAAREVLANDNRFDSERFNICIANGMGKKIVDADIALGVRFGVSFTPTLFLNEKRFVGNRDLASLRRLLLRTSSLEH
jgi:protein-disulfide isomerase